VKGVGTMIGLTHKDPLPVGHRAVPRPHSYAHSRTSRPLNLRLLISTVVASVTSSDVTCLASGTNGTGPTALPNASVSRAKAAFDAENCAAMTRMMAGMDVNRTGDGGRDFVAMMVPHHQGAIDMAEAELRYGRNVQLLRLAQQIVVEQVQEIAAMRIAVGEEVSRSEALLAAAVPAAPAPVGVEKSARSLKAEAPFIAENNSAMERMMKGMTITPSGDVDHDFVALMVPHHHGGIDMAEAELRRGGSANHRLRIIAQEIIVDQRQEIVLMRLALGEALPPSGSSPTDPLPPTRE
jgi:uncharacterized protein (DUF305 family)